MRYLLMCWISGAALAQTMDVWVADQFGFNRFYEQQMNGFTDSGQELGDSISQSIGVGDLNGDGSLDVAVANNGACYVYHNDGSGIFSRESAFGAVLPDATSMALADMDQNGTLDLVMATKTGQMTGDNQIFLNDGSGLFVTPSSLFGFGETRSLSVADLNGDGFPDVFEANSLFEPNRVLFNDMSGELADSGQTLGNASSFSVALGDLDGNGTLDAVVANDGQPNSVWMNDGLGNFSLLTTLGGNANSLAVALGDLDGDGSLDIVFGNDGAISSAPLMVFFNDGSAQFTASVQVFPSPRTVSLHVTDLDRDGRNDILMGNIGADRVWINEGSGLFSALPDDLSTGFSSSLSAGYFSATRVQAQTDWSQEWTVIDMLRFDRQLRSQDGHLRGR